jgi:ring-1,2-phenylacetyl-CoA epoxidase subunit PaaE
MRSFRVNHRHWETRDTATLLLTPVDGGPLPTYEAGQFITLIFNTLSREKRRMYSLSSAPQPSAEALQITVKRVTNGEFSNWLLDHADVGTVLQVAPPTGQFVLPTPLPERLVYVAAGSGITPVWAHLEALFSGSTPPPQVRVLLANRDADSTIFKPRLDALAAAHPGLLQVEYLFSSARQRLTQEVFERWLWQHFTGPHRRRQLHQAHFYLCAPVALMRMAAMNLRVLDVPEAHIHRELFLSENALPQRTPDPTRTRHIHVEKQGQVIDFETFDGETILGAALRQGIDLPYTCKSGVCFTCIARCTSGEVEVAFSGETRHEHAGALVNTCIGYAASDEVGLLYD